MSKGFIRQSSSAITVPGLFTKTPDGRLRFVIDYWHINSETIINRYPLPLLGESLNHLWGTQIYTKYKVRGVYNLLRLKEGDDYKLDFRMKVGLFEPTVIQFEMANAPRNFHE